MHYIQLAYHIVGLLMMSVVVVAVGVNFYQWKEGKLFARECPVCKSMVMKGETCECKDT